MIYLQKAGKNYIIRKSTNPKFAKKNYTPKKLHDKKNQQ